MAHAIERPATEIVIADTHQLFDQCMAVRLKVFADEQGFPVETEADEYDEISVHFLLRLVPGLDPIGTIRLVPKYLKLGRLAVLSAYRKFKFGAALVLAVHDWVLRQPSAETGSESGFYEIICHSQIPVKPFYAKFGYVEEGQEFDEDGAPHQLMRAKLIRPMPNVE